VLRYCVICSAADPAYRSTVKIDSRILVSSVAVCSKGFESKYLAQRGCHVVEKPKRKNKSNQQSESCGSTSNKRQRQREQSTALSRFPPRHIVHQLLRGERGQEQEQAAASTATLSVEEVGEFTIAADVTRVEVTS
jgi:hypothetical protein